MRYRVWFLVVAGVLLISVYSYADVPKMINFQGRLTDATGKFVTDGNYSLTFRIYSDSTGGSSKWSETQSVAIGKGLFNAILGSNTPIPDSIFNYPNTWLSIQVASDPEMTPRQRLSSLGYSYRGAKADTSNYSKDSDKLDGLHAADFSSMGTDYGRSGVAADLYEGVTTLTNKYVNVVGPDSVYSTNGTAFKGKVAGSNAVALYGLQGSAANTAAGNTFGTYGYASNTSNGASYAGYFTTSDSGTGMHFGVVGDASGSSSGDVYGVLGSGFNTSSGNVYGGSFITSQMGTGIHYGVQAQGLASSTSATYGISALGSNSSSGAVYGGFFSTVAAGTGTHYGIRTESYGNNSAADFGIYSSVDNTSSGSIAGGYFSASSNGTGTHYGVRGLAYGSSDANVYGLHGYGSNTSTGDVYGGYCSTASSGTGNHYGLYSLAYGGSDSSTYGCYGYGSNTSTGDVYGGFFKTSNLGTGVHFGIKAESYGNSASSVNGINVKAENTSTGPAYGGIFSSISSGTGSHYGTYSSSTGSSANTTYGVCGTASNTSNGGVYGGYFVANNYGTGGHEGVAGFSYGSTGSVIGVHGYASSAGTEYGGYFAVADTVGVYKRGIFASASSEYSWNYAGLFMGHVDVSADLYVSGSKSAVVKIDNGEFRSLYSQESPENWFEDFGEGQLVNGRAHIELDPMFLQTVTINSQYPMKVFIQLNDENCKGTAVKRGVTGFDVVELQNGTSSASFSYRIVAKRKGYEDRRLTKFEGPTPEELKAESAKIQADMEKERAKKEQENRAMANEK